MAWYRGGTVAVTNGNATITGTGTDFVANVGIGEGWIGPDGRVYEIAAVGSATQLTLAIPYQGASGNGQGYAIVPTSSFARDLALNAANLLNTFAAVRDGIGQGLIPAGTLAVPGVRFAVDQDTGFRRVAENSLALVGGGVDRLMVGAGGEIGIGRAPIATIALSVASPSPYALYFTVNASSSPGQPAFQIDGGTVTAVFGPAGSGGYGYVGTVSQHPIVFVTGNTDRGRIDQAGNMLIGTTSSAGWGNAHRITRAGQAQGAALCSIDGGTDYSAAFFAANEGGYSNAATAIRVGRNSATGRSINAGGTINAQGADYAEYIAKRDGCGEIAKGEVCGIDKDGRLTRRWAEAISFVVKSTNPSLVGGDAWAAACGPEPTPPGPAPVRPVAPVPPGPEPTTYPEPVRAEDEEQLDFIRRMAAWLVDSSAAAATNRERPQHVAAYDAAVAAYAEAAGRYPADAKAHEDAVAAYERDKHAWDAAMEAARTKVDRIAFSGQVPVNCDAETLAACRTALDRNEAVYLVAVMRGRGIGVAGVPEKVMTLPQYMHRIGKVWTILGDRPWVDVQHG